MACDKCVPRGCSCNIEPDPNIMAEYNGDYNDAYLWKDENLIEHVDDFGRKLPCIEWETLPTRKSKLSKMGMSNKDPPHYVKINQNKS